MYDWLTSFLSILKPFYQRHTLPILAKKRWSGKQSSRPDLIVQSYQLETREQCEKYVKS